MKPYLVIVKPNSNLVTTKGKEDISKHKSLALKKLLGKIID